MPAVVTTLTKRPLIVRPEGPRAVIIHGTGESDLTKVLKYYTDENGYQPHYVIGLNGVIYQTALEYQLAYHCAIMPAERILYRAGYQHWSTHVWHAVQRVAIDKGEEQPRYRSWRDFWRHGKGLESPLDLITGSSPNAVSIGIELQSPIKRWPEIYSLAQYQALAELVHDIGYRYRIPLNREHLLGHSDCSPMRRSSEREGLYDPGERFSWNRLFDLLGLLDDTPTDPGITPAA